MGVQYVNNLLSTGNCYAEKDFEERIKMQAEKVNELNGHNMKSAKEYLYVYDSLS